MSSIFEPDPKRRPKVTEFLGVVDADDLDSFIANWMTRYLEESIERLYIQNDGDAIWSRIQEKLNDKWSAENKGELAVEFDRVEYLGFNFARRKDGYIKYQVDGVQYFTWVKLDD